VEEVDVESICGAKCALFEWIVRRIAASLSLTSSRPSLILILIVLFIE